MSRKEIMKRVLCFLLSIAMVLSNINISSFVTDTYAQEEIQEGEGEPNEEEPAQTELNRTKFNLQNAEIKYQDDTMINSTQTWGDLLRPVEFVQEIVFEQIYIDENGDEQTVLCYAQDYDASADLYIKFVHDGMGAGTFDVISIPRTVTVSGKEYQIKQYDIYVDTPYPYYQSTVAQIQNVATIDSASNSTIELKMVTQSMELSPYILPADSVEEPDFTYNISLTNTVESKTEISAAVATVKAKRNSHGEIQIPAGISYEVSQVTPSDYKFNGEYKITIGEGEEEKKESAVGTAEADTVDEEGNTVSKKIVIATDNYAQNVQLGFKVLWIDNNSVNRPAVNKDNFILKYQIIEEGQTEETAEWKEYKDTAEEKEELGLDYSPAFDTSKSELGQYYYTGLPSSDKNGNPVKFKIELNEELIPEDYVAFTDEEDGQTVFSFEELTGFHAEISWKDNSDKNKDDEGNSYRPSFDQYKNNLHLYRRIGNGKFEAVYAGGGLPEGAFSHISNDKWQVDIPELPRYNDKNEEYDYVLVHGSIDTETGNVTIIPIANYQAYVNNGSGSFGNDYILCHNRGKVTELLSGVVDFKAKKVWKDQYTTTEEINANRPDAVVTLFRCVDDGKSTISELYNAGKASQVVYYTTKLVEYKDYTTDEEGKPVEVIKYRTEIEEKLVSINIGKVDTEFNFDSLNILLEEYDGQGHRYLYFVRETLEGDNAENYGAKYYSVDKDGNLVEEEGGTANGGTVKNIHREKAVVNAAKTWKNPSGLADIEGISTQLIVSIPEITDNGDGTATVSFKDFPVLSSTPKSYEEVTGADLVDEQSAVGFTAYIPSSEVMYYINICDENGNRYDMDNTIIREVVFKNGVESAAVYTATETEPESTDPGVFTSGGKSWRITGEVTIVGADGTDKTYISKLEKFTASEAVSPREYSYRISNTISEKRSYELIKDWDTSIINNEIEMPYFEKVTGVEFILQRRSTADETKPYETVGTYEVSKNSETGRADGDKAWNNLVENLDKYDQEGYLYIYRATENMLVLNDGSRVTMSEYNNMKKADNSDCKNWSVDHHWTKDETTAVNYIGTGGYGYLNVTKNWNDNGDEAGRQNITIRVYLKEDIQKAFEQMTAEQLASYYTFNTYNIEGIVTSDLAALTYTDAEGNTQNVRYAEFSLNKSNDYYSEIGYTSIADQMLKLSESSLTDEEKISARKEFLNNNNRNSSAAYLVLEHKVGDGLVQYSYSDINANLANTGKNSFKINGIVVSSTRQYRVYVGYDSGIYIKNTRFGTTSIEGIKKWKDNGDSDSYRPEAVTFQLYRDGEAYVNIPDSVTVRLETEAEGGSVSLNRETGIVTLQGAAQAETWKFIIENLDMYDDKSVPYVYSMDEGETATSAPNVTYIQKKVSTVMLAGSDMRKQSFSMEYENTISGTINHVAYKFWKDPAKSPELRPDLYITLYRRVNGGEYVAINDYGDLKWTNYDKVKNADEPEQYYSWKIEACNLPMYDEDGNRYEYLFKEEMNHNGSTVLGTYVGETVTKDGYEVFTNVLVDYMSVEGKKTWKGITGFEADELPEPYIILYRTQDETIEDIQGMTDEEFAEVSEKLELVDVTQLVDSKSSYTFPHSGTIKTSGMDIIDNIVHADVSDYTLYVTSTDYNGNVTEIYNSGHFMKTIVKNSFGQQVSEEYYLPKYDENGKEYYYLVRESIVDPIASQLYTRQNTNGTLANEFKTETNRRSIEVTKNWPGFEELAAQEKKYHSVTFELYRYELTAAVDESGKVIRYEGSDIPKFVYDASKAASAKKIAEYTISPADFAAGKNSHTFENLLIFSPTGVQYGYYVVEKSINGYTAAYTDEAGLTGELTENERCDVISLPLEQWNKEKSELTAEDKEALTVSVSTANTYSDPAKAVISGNKIWNDHNNAEELRPIIPVYLKLERSTNNEKEAKNYQNKLDAYDVGINKVLIQEKVYEWQKTAEGKWELIESTEALDKEREKYIEWNLSGSVWTYSIHNLEKYAPNGMPYIYTLTEDKSTAPGYGQTAPVKAGIGNDNTAVMGNIENSFTGSYYVRKNWMDGSNKYDLRPKSITVVLLRSSDGGVTFDAIPWSEGYPEAEGYTWKHTLFENSEIAEGTRVVSVKLTADNVKKNTRNNSWEYTFTNLPTVDKNGNEYVYRCEEVKIGEIPVEKKIEGKKVKYTDGTYERVYTTYSDEKTVIENTLNSTYLEVIKQWEGDQDNLYQSRPEKLTFVLQKKGIMVRESNNGEATDPAEGAPGESDPIETDWAPVMIENGTKEYTFTISEGENWTKKLEDLPVAEVVYVNNTAYTVYNLYFRAVEVHADETAKTAYGAENYVDVTEDSDHTRIENHNVSKITNKLIVGETPTDITVNKYWKRTENSEDKQTAVFELSYKKIDKTTNLEETEWHTYTDAIKWEYEASKTENSSYTWSNLPLYDREGNRLIYMVTEQPIEGYKTELVTDKDTNPELAFATEYTFTNIELKNYSVEKLWQSESYGQKTAEGYTATFKLYQKVEGDENWSEVTGAEEKTLICTEAKGTKTSTWNNLPKYTSDGSEITYKAVETKINGIEVANDTNGYYIVTYKYDGENEPEFTGTKTTATNRMVYGFVNLDKTAAYLAPAVTPEGTKLENIVFDIYSVSEAGTEVLYASGIKTGATGNLLINTDGTYGTEAGCIKKLVTGKYILKERSSNADTTDYSVWSKGIEFSIGLEGGTTDTGEHGTAWVVTDTSAGTQISLKVEYKHSELTHSYEDVCRPVTNEGIAVNIESRGVVEFTKTGKDGTELISHKASAGENTAYFGIYLEKECINQIAGMKADLSVDENGRVFELTNLAEDGSSLTELKKDDTIPYIRAFAHEKYKFTLLSGTYYIKELTPPAGYKLDETVRTLVVGDIKTTVIDEDISEVYPNNKGKIEGSDSYKWANEPNVIQIYKRDQYGRRVNLNGKALELKVTGEGNKFLTGEDTIYLYQDKTKAATDSSGNSIQAISYQEDTGIWTITGLLSPDCSYQLLEPDESVPANSVKAYSYDFTINEAGEITVTSAHASAKDDPLSVVGADYDNYYHSAAEGNILVLRDVARYLKDIEIKKVETGTETVIPDISFVLYKYDEAAGKYVSVLEEGVYLTTAQIGAANGDAAGTFKLMNLPDGVKNLITGCDLRYGLDVGKYYLSEVERGAADRYVLVKRIDFEINPNTTVTIFDENDNAVVKFDTTNAKVSQNEGSKTGVISNDPAKNINVLDITKTDREEETVKLEGAKFVLTYVSSTKGDTGSLEGDTIECVTDSNGILCYASDNTQTIDISRKGKYELKEVLAPNSYMTVTEGTEPVTILKFEVNEEHKIVNTESSFYYNSSLLKSGDCISEDQKAVIATVYNDKTKVYLQKLNDIYNGKKNSDQTTLNGESLSGADLVIKDSEGNQVYSSKTAGSYTIPDGTLKENVIYTLSEAETPVGYLKADDICFKIFGTIYKGAERVSQIYVWTGDGAATASGDGWSRVNASGNTTNVSSNVLTMVDEAVIAPVDMQKVVGDTTYEALSGAVFEVKAGDKLLGTAISGTYGYLVWESIEDGACMLGLIYSSAGQRITSEDKNTVIGKTIILRKNDAAYSFTEIYAPDIAYNEGKTYYVNISDENYIAYKQSENKDKYVDIVQAGSAAGYTSGLIQRDTEAAAADLVNPGFKAEFVLYKYDAEHDKINAAHDNYEDIGLSGVEFTLTKIKDAKGNSVTAEGVVYTTGDKGLLSIPITEKGTYTLKETKTNTGYILSTTELEFTIINSDYNKKLTYSDSTTYKTAEVTATQAEYDLANYRNHGEVTLLKKDAESGVKLNGVKYILKRVSPDRNENVDNYFPVNDGITVETGKTYDKLSDAENAEGIVVTSGADGLLTIKDLQWGTYTLVESQENEGYVLRDGDANTFTFEIKPDKLVTTVTDNNKEYVENTKNRLTVKKTDLLGNLLQKAKFSLYAVENGQITNTATKFYKEVATAVKAETEITAGETTIYGIPAGTYVIKETLAPLGYELAEPVTFTIDRYGVISNVSCCDIADGTVTANANSFAALDGITISIKDTPIQVSLDKNLVAFGGEAVAINGRGNAEFKIKGEFADSDGRTTEKTFNKNSISTELDHMLIGGKNYTITETKAPAGYKVRKEAATIYVDVYGKITVNNGDAFLKSDNNGEDGVAKMVYTDKPIELGLNKLDENGEYIDQEALSEAKFSITGRFVSADGSSVGNDTITELTTTNFHDTLSGRLVGGETYTVKETYSPYGYKLTGEFTIKVDIYGDVTTSFADASIKKGENSPFLNVKNYPNTITFVKTDDNGLLAGAEFTLVPLNSAKFVNTTAEDKPAAASEWTESCIRWISSNEAAGFTITRHLQANESYKLTETRVNNHEVMGELILHITPEGNVVIDTNPSIPNNGLAATLEGNEVTIDNPVIKGEVTLTKYYTATKKDVYDEADYVTGQELSGAVYELYCTKDYLGAGYTERVHAEPMLIKTDSANSYVYSGGTKSSFTTDAAGKIVITNLPEGEYYFKEVDAPKAYYIDTEKKIEFVIHEAENAKTAVVHIDPRINADIELTKLTTISGAESSLSGAEFTVQYRPESTGDYKTVATVTSDTNGKISLTQAVYDTASETLRRGFYLLTEQKAADQMLNTTDGSRNTIAFEIGNDYAKVYDIKSGTGVDYTLSGQYISLTANGVKDTPIPLKAVTVNKNWIDDIFGKNTFRPPTVTVQLYRSYNNGEAEAVGGPVTLSSEEWTHTWSNLPSYVNVEEGGAEVTYLYTYSVKETNTKSWYADTYSYETETGNAGETGIKDGNTAATVDNTLDGGNTPVTLTINKLLGGGSSEDEFEVRVKLTSTDATVGNTGYYLDSCKRISSDGTESDITPDADGWMKLKGGESISLNLPKNVYGTDNRMENYTYEVEEKTSEGVAVYTGTSGYSYTPRYESSKKQTTEKDHETTVRNAVHKTIGLTKVDNATALSGAKYSVSYKPVANADNPEAVGIARILEDCSVVNGVMCDSSNNPIDITMQGTYTIKETKAPDNYITPTDNAGEPIIIAVITVNSLDILSVAKGTGNTAAYANTNSTELVTTAVTKADGSRTDITLNNEKTVARIGKLIDYAKLQNSDSEEGTYLVGARLVIKQGETVIEEWTTTAQEAAVGYHLTTAGRLSENVVYTLCEMEVPNGYKKAADVYFVINGTCTASDGKRYSRIVITDEAGTALTDQNTSGSAYGKAGVVDGVLNLADETIIAPVDLQKVLKNRAGNQWSAVSGVKFTVKDGDTLLGVAKTDSKGYLVWESITDAGYASKLIYDASGRVVTKTAGTKTTTGIGNTVILRQKGIYTFTESYAPSNVYNDGRSVSVSITEANYDDYRTGATTGLYNTSKYINLVEAEGKTGKTVDALSVRGNQVNYTSEADVSTKAVNLSYRSFVNLHKYDSDEEAKKVGIADTEFTLYKGEVKAANIYKKAYYKDGTAANSSGVFVTDASGNLEIEIPEKGTYILVETKAAQGYELDSSNPPSFTFKLTDKTETDTFAYDERNELKTDTDGISNNRIMGSVTLIKKDDETGEMLDGVEYTITRKTFPDGLSGLLLTESAVVVTGKNYTAEKTAEGWKLSETDGTAGTIQITGLNWAEYELVEKTEKSGYVLDTENNKYSFTVTSSSLSRDFSVTHTNSKNVIKLYKTNSLDAEAGVTELKPLKGAVFEIHEGAAGDCTSHTAVEFYASDTATTTVTSVVSGEDGTVNIYGLATDITGNTPKTYHLVETKAPYGYKLQSPVEFTIGRDGNTTVGGEDSSKKVTMSDEPIKISIQKYGENSDALKGAVFTLADDTENCSDCETIHKLADGTGGAELTITSDTGKLLIPIEKLIAGHSYILTETKAPDGYECTAIVKFKVNTDGTVADVTSEGGYKASGSTPCADTDATNTTINIRNEKIRMTLTKVDADAGETKLSEVKFTVTPQTGSAFAIIDSSLSYDSATNTITFTTNADGKIEFPEALFKHENSYLLKETETNSGYYLGKESSDGVILTVDKKGEFSISRLTAYEANVIDGISSCPVIIEGNKERGVSLIAKNMKSSSFELTKLVEGNMGDLSGRFKIKLSVYEPDGTFIAERTVELKLNERYNSETGLNGSNGFGKDAFPVGSTLVISEDNELDYSAEVRVKTGTATVTDTEDKGCKKVKLESNSMIELELVNKKEVLIDMGVPFGSQAPFMFLAIVVPAAWLAYRYRRRCKGGDYR